MSEPPTPAGYRAALEAVAVIDRSRRARFTVTGRSPGQMLDGVLTCTIPAPPESVEDGVFRGRGYYGLVLTAKGKLVTDLRVFPLEAGGGGEAGAEATPGSSAAPGPAGPMGAMGPGSSSESPHAPSFLLDVPRPGVEPLVEHFGKFLPPRLAKNENVSDATGMLTVLGPGAPELLSREALGLRVDPPVLNDLSENHYRLVGTRFDEGVAVVRTRDVAAPAWDLIADAGTIRSLKERMLETSAAELAPDAWRALRIEAGRPDFGVDMDRDTIPVEAGVHDRAIDYAKGCYTGQEVIVRIRDRGRVNWHLRGVLLGGEAPPPADTELFSPEEEKAVGRITGSVHSPRLRQTVGLAYVRREVEPPAALHLGEEGGPEVQVRELGEGWGS